MKRSGSVASSFTSFSSGGNSTDDGLTGGKQDNNQSNILSTRSTKLDAIFEAVVSLPNMTWEATRRYASVVLFFDIVQMLLFIIHPIWGWENLNYHHNIFWKWLARFQIQNAAAELQVTGFSGVFWVTAILTWFVTGLWIYIGYCKKAARTPPRLLLRITRFLSCVLHEVLFISVLNIFMVPLACDYWNKMIVQSTPGYWRGRLFYFPKETCFSGSTSILAVIAILSTPLHIAMGLMTLLRRFEPSLTTRKMLVYFNARFALRSFVAKVFISLVFHLSAGYRPEISTFVIFVCYWYINWVTIRRQLWSNRVTMAIRSAVGTWFVFAALMLFLTTAFTSAFSKKSTGTAIWASLPLLLVGWALAYWRWRASRKLAFKYRETEEREALRNVHRYSDVWGIETVVRAIIADRDHEGHLNDDNVRICEEVCKAGALLYPDNPHMCAVYASVLGTRVDYSGAQAYIEKGRKILKTAAYVKFMLYVMRFHSQMQADSKRANNDTMDIISYVEFQNAFKVLLQVHKSALKSARDFWRALMHHDVRVAELIASVSKVDRLAGVAEANYKAVMERYPKSVKLLRAFGRFLADVKNDPWAAQRYFNEADKLEENMLNEQAQALASTDGAAGGHDVALLQKIDETSDAVCTINQEGTITFANKLLCKTFGFRKAEIEGRNVSALMPAPFNTQHNSYLRNYLTTGKAKILNTVREVVGMHREKYVFPVTIMVTKVNQGGQEGYMGVIRSLPDDSAVGKAWLTKNGVIACVSRGFSDLLGFKSSEVAGKQLRSISTTPDLVSEMVDNCLTLREGEEGAATLSFRHRFGDELAFKAEYHIGGTENVRLVVVYLRVLEERAAMMTVDGGGRIVYANRKFCSILGCKDSDLRDASINDILPAPFGPLHAYQFLRQRAPAPPLPPCLTEQGIALMDPRSERPVHVILEQKDVQPFVIGGSVDSVAAVDRGLSDRLFMFRVTPVGFDQYALGYRLQLVLDLQGNILNAACAQETFGYLNPSELVGRQIAAFIPDVPADVGALLMRKLAKTSDGKSLFRASWRNSLGRATAATLETDASVDQIKMSVYRTERIQAVLYVDRMTDRIVQASEMAGILFGFGPRELLEKEFKDLLTEDALPSQRAEDLLAEAKKKGGISTKTRAIGTRKTVECRHRDGQALSLSMIASERPYDPEIIAVAVRLTDALPQPYPSRLLPDKKEVEAAKRHVNETSRLTRQMSMNSQLADRVNMRVSAGPSARKLSLVAPAAAPEVAGMAGREQSMSPVLGNPGGGGGGGMMIVPQKSGTKVSLMPRYASPAGSGINVPIAPRRRSYAVPQDLPGRAGSSREGSQRSVQLSEASLAGREEDTTLSGRQFKASKSISRFGAQHAVKRIAKKEEMPMVAAAGEKAAGAGGILRGADPAPGEGNLGAGAVAGLQWHQNPFYGEAGRGSMGIDLTPVQTRPLPVPVPVPQPEPSAPDLDAPDGSEEDDEGEWERRAAAGEPGPASNFLLHWIDNLSLPTALAATLPPEAITQQLSRRERAAGLGEAPSVRGRALDDPTKPVMLKEDSHHLLDYIPKEAAIVHRPNNLPSRFSMGPKQGEVLDSPLGPPTPLPAPVIVPHPDFDDDETGEGSDPAGRKSLGAALTGIEPMETGAVQYVEDVYGTAYDDEPQGSADGGAKAAQWNSLSAEDYARGKRFRKIGAVFQNDKTNTRILRYARYARWALLLIAATHIAGFVVVVTVANLWRSFTKNGTMAAESPKLVYRILTYCRLLEASGRGAFSLQSRPDTTTGLDAVIEELSTSHRTLYFAFASGKKNAFKPLSSLYDSPNLNYVVTNTTRIAPTTGLWDLVNLFLGSARQVAQGWSTYPAPLSEMPDWLFVMLNGAQNLVPNMNLAARLQIVYAQRQIKSSLNILLAILLLECVAVIPLCSVIVFSTIRTVALERHRRFGLFLVIPVHVVQELASREIAVGDDDDDEDELHEEERAVQPTGGAPKPAAKLRIATKKSARHASHRPQDRSLSENNLPTYLRLLWPLLAFLAVVVVVLAMSWVLATGNAAQVHQIYEANQLEQGVEQLLHTAAEQSLMDPGAADAAYTAAQGSTRDAAGVMYGTMTSLTFGNASLSIPPGGLRNAKLWTTVYAPRCWRAPAPCYPPSHPYNPATTTGADNLVRASWLSALHLSQTPRAYANESYPHFRFLYDVLPNDVASAASSIGQVYELNVTGPVVLESINAALLVILVMGGGLYYLRLLTPFLSTIWGEARLVASLLSSCNRDFNIEGFVAEVYVKGGAPAGKKEGGATASAYAAGAGDDEGDDEGIRPVSVLKKSKK